MKSQVVYVDHAGTQADGIGGGVCAVGESECQADILAIDIAGHVNQFERTPEPCLAGSIAFDIGSEGRHVVAQESDLQTVGIECHVKRIGGYEYLAIHIRMSFVALQYISKNRHRFSVVVPFRAQYGIAEQGIIVCQALDA